VLPAGREGCPKRGKDGIARNLGPQLVDRPEGVVRVRGQWTAPEPVVLARDRATPRLGLPQGDKEVGQAGSELRKVRDSPFARRFTVNPTVDRPGVGIAELRSTSAYRRRNRERQLRGKQRQPALLLVDLLRVPVAIR
jgi:hypothetical protein